jgi:hypothetical protein
VRRRFDVALREDRHSLVLLDPIPLASARTKARERQDCLCNGCSEACRSTSRTGWCPAVRGISAPVRRGNGRTVQDNALVLAGRVGKIRRQQWRWKMGDGHGA